MTIIYLSLHKGIKSNERRSFVYCYDVVKAIFSLINCFNEIKEEKIMHSEKKSKKVLPEVLNIGGPSGLSRLDLTKVLGKATQTNLVIHDNEQVSKS